MEDFDPEKFTSLKGFFLIAMPEMADPFFGRSVICICEHTPQGALGFVINHPHTVIRLSQIFDEFNMEFKGDVDEPLLIGGPVQLDEIFVLHGAPITGQSTLAVTSELGLSNTHDILERLGKEDGIEEYLVTLGCSGWGPGQLEKELMENAWLTTPLSLNVIFDVAVENRWDEAVRSAGIDPALLNSTPGHA